MYYSCFRVVSELSQINLLGSSIHTLHTTATRDYSWTIACHMPSESREALPYHYLNCVIDYGVLCANGTTNIETTVCVLPWQWVIFWSIL